MKCRGFLHYPPAFSPEYENETGAFFYLEFEIEKASVEAERLDRASAISDDAQRDALEDAAAAAWNRYNKLKRELSDLESGW